MLYYQKLELDRVSPSISGLQRSVANISESAQSHPLHNIKHPPNGVMCRSSTMVSGFWGLLNGQLPRLFESHCCWIHCAKIPLLV